MSDLRRAAEKAVAAWNQYRTAESLRGWMEILEAALEQPDQDRFCDRHCTWRDHHPECVRAEQPIIEAKIKTDKSEPCRYPDCVDNGPEGKCMRWLLAECSKSEDFKPRREWQGLDAEEILGMTCECDIDYECAINFGKDIEAALKERNA